MSLPQSIVRRPQLWQPQHGAFYAAGIHPWWTADADFVLDDYLDALSHLLTLSEVVQVGECGLDRLRGADLETQCAVFAAQVALAEQHHRPMTLHVVRAFDVILALRKQLRPQQRWTVHGFRGKPALARQLLDAGFDLSFGFHHNSEALAITPPERRHFETDALPEGEAEE